MWYRNENGSSVKPAAIDQTSSGQYVYIRKNFRLIEESVEGEQVIPKHWEWYETKILKDDWEIYLEVMDHGSALDDVYAALTELAEIIAGEGE